MKPAESSLVRKSYPKWPQCNSGYGFIMNCRESCSHIWLHRYEIPGLAPLQEPAEVEDDTEAQTQKPPKA